MDDAKTVLITGATSGIGRATAMHLGRRGYHVIATGRRKALLDSLSAEAHGGTMTTHRLDVTSAESLAALKDVVDRLTHGDGVDVLINNAGYGLAGPLVELSDAKLRDVFETNVFGLMAVTRAFVSRMIERKAGRIVNISSIGGRVTYPLMGAYSATKYAIEALSDALRVELSPFGVRVIVIEPGSIASEFSSTAMDTLDTSASSPYRAAVAAAAETNARFAQRAVGPDVIARTIEKAVTAERPAARYVAPFNARLTLFISRWLGTSCVDAMQARAMGLTPDRMGAGSA